MGDVRLDVLSPHECYTGTESDTNNDALVIRLTHGAATSVAEFFEAEAAPVAVVSVGENTYGHHKAFDSRGPVVGRVFHEHDRGHPAKGPF